MTVAPLSPFPLLRWQVYIPCHDRSEDSIGKDVLKEANLKLTNLQKHIY